MNLRNTIININKTKNSFFNLKKGNWVNMDILKPNILFYVDCRNGVFEWEKENIKLSGYYKDIYICRKRYNNLYPYVVIDFSKVDEYSLIFVMRLYS